MRKTTKVYYDERMNCGYAFTEKGIRFLFDMKDADVIRNQAWHFTQRGYVSGKMNRKERPLHKFLLLADAGMDIDHINGDKLDNRRCNLRICTHQENCFNQKRRCTNSSGYMGVAFHKAAEKYEAYINVNGKKIYLGLHDTAEAAARIRDLAAVKFFGEFARLNFAEVA